MKVKLEGAQQAEVKKIQTAIDDLLAVCNDQKEQLQHNVKELAEAAKTITSLTGSTGIMAGSIRDIFSILGSKKDLWKDDKEMNDLMNSIALIISGSGFVKLGVIQNAKNEQV